MKNKKFASELLEANPFENQVHITKDGQGFFNELDATNHSKKMGFNEDPEVFFRDGFEPEDQKELQEAYEAAEAENKELKNVILQVVSATKLENEVLIVSQDTPEAISGIVTLRETITDLQTSKGDLAEAIGRICDVENDVPTLQLSDDNLEIAQKVLILRGNLAEVVNELNTLKATSIDVKEGTADTVEEKPTPATNKVAASTKAAANANSNKQ